MSPITHSCNLCGFTIRPARPRQEPISWLSEFRAVVSPLRGFARLTGVGLFVDSNTGSFVAPPESDTRWNSNGHRREHSEEFGVQAQFKNGLYGYLFHESCWSVLERVFHPDRVPLDRLYELCLSMPKPIQTHCLNWGHDYGGLYFWEESPCYPWDAFEDPGVYDMDDLEDSDSGDSEASREWAERYGLPPPRDDDFDESDRQEPTLRASTITSDPYRLNEALVILQEQPRPPPARPASFWLSGATADRFSRLPRELRSAVACYLPTADFLNGRLALRGLWDIFDSQQFWATRFRGRGAERAWFFESHQSPGCGRDWRFLYKQTSDDRVSHSGGMRNRRRVWELALRLQDVLSLKTLTRLISFEEEEDDDDEDLKCEDFEWISTGGDIRDSPPEHPHVGFDRGCRVLHKQRVWLRSQEAYKIIALAFTQVGEQSYLSGLILTYGDGQDFQIGYTATDEHIVDLDFSTRSGFRLAIGPRGVQGLQVVTHDGSSNCSRWYGRQEDVPQTNCLLSEAPIVALEFGLDACKIVSIAVARDRELPETTIATAPAHQAPDILRQAGLWFPDVPPPHVQLNQSSFPRALHYASGFRPLIWVRFGGTNGIFLKHLVALQFHFQQDLYAIEFKYNDPAVPDICHSLGRHKCDGPTCYGDHCFSIDGPGGERIASINVALLTWDDGIYNHLGQITSVANVKIETTRGRSFSLRNKKDLRRLARDMDGKLFTARVEAKRGTILTGLYAHQVQFHGNWSHLVTLGVISESS